MNFTNFRETPLDRVYAAIGAEAEVASCQLVGFIPLHAFEMFPDFFRRAENFDESRVIETRIATIKASVGND
jgi:glutamate formiminotransferase